MGVSEQYHLPAGGLYSNNSLSGMMNLKSHYNLASGRDTIINSPPKLISINIANFLRAYYVNSSDRDTWIGWPGTNYVPLFNDFSQQTNAPLKRGDVIILIMFSARGSFHVSQSGNVFTKNRIATWNTFGTFTVQSGTGLSAHWIRIPQNATNDQLLNEYPYVTRADVTAGVALGSSTIPQNITDGTTYILRGVPSNRNPTLNTSITGAWSDADTNEIAQRTVLQDFGKYNTLYLNYVYTPIVTTSAPPDAYPDTFGLVIPNDFSNGDVNGLNNSVSDNGQYETWSTSWVSDNIPKMYSTSPIYHNRLQRHNFNNRTFPAITGFFDTTGGILIEIPY